MGWQGDQIPQNKRYEQRIRELRALVERLCKLAPHTSACAYWYSGELSSTCNCGVMPQPAAPTGQGDQR